MHTMHHNAAEKAASIIITGAAPDTANLGVSALSVSVVNGIAQRIPGARITVLDFGRGRRSDSLQCNGHTIEFDRFGSVNTKRLYRPESIYGMAICAAFGGLGHPGLNLLRNAAAVLDISGGDSFTDLYGPSIFRSISLRKQLAIGQGAPLVLLPQTYGPFKQPRSQAIAARIVRGAAMCWARDERSYEVLRGLLGGAFDARKHRLGVDVAFALPTAEPPAGAIAPIAHWLNDSETPIVGINASGLLMNTPGAARDQYGFKADYQQVLEDLARRFLRETNARLLLVPHVVTERGNYESDIDACETIAAAVQHEAPERVAVCPALHDPTHIKWVIARCNWFCGTRMHSTIAALSSGVPTAAIAYSPKTLGVFESCAQGEHVADPRELDTEAVVEHLWQSWNARDTARDTLAKALPAVKQTATAQMDAIADTILRGPESITIQ